MNYKYLFLVVFLVTFSLSSNAQLCILDLGSKNSEQVKQVFQLNEEQTNALETFKIEVNREISNLEAEVKELLKNHPQSNPDELTILAKKHKDLENQMFTITAEYDQKLLTLFNEKQYERYLLLCEKANRTPIAKLEE